MKNKIVHDENFCIGCKCCQMACKDKHDFPTGINLISIQEEEIKNKDGSIGLTYHAHMCHQCQNPMCLKSCPVNAIYKNGDGVVLIKEQDCVGCGKCVQNCPFHAVFMYSDEKKAKKCDGCIDEIKNGKLPVCVRACPMQTLIYNKNNSLLEV